MFTLAGNVEYIVHFFRQRDHLTLTVFEIIEQITGIEMVHFTEQAILSGKSISLFHGANGTVNIVHDLCKFTRQAFYQAFAVKLSFACPFKAVRQLFKVGFDDIEEVVKFPGDLTHFAQSAGLRDPHVSIALNRFFKG